MKEKTKFRSPLEFVQASSDNPSHTLQSLLGDDKDPEISNESSMQNNALLNESKNTIYPWENAHPKLKEQFTLRLPERLHKQLGYLAEKSPDSMHTIAIIGVEMEVIRRLQELGIKT